MAEKQLKATAKLFVDTKDAKSDAQQFFADIRRHMNDLEKDANKLKVFQSLSEYIAIVDKNLSALKANNPNVFEQMFGDIDNKLRKSMEDTLSYAKNLINDVGTLGEKIAQTQNLRTDLDRAMRDISAYKKDGSARDIVKTREEAEQLLATYKRLHDEINNKNVDKTSLEYQQKRIEYMRVALKLAASSNIRASERGYSLSADKVKEFNSAGDAANAYISDVTKRISNSINSALDKIVTGLTSQIANIKINPNILNVPTQDDIDDAVSAYSQLNTKLEEYRNLVAEANAPNTSKNRRRELLNMTASIQEEIISLGSLSEDAEEDFNDILDNMTGGEISQNEALQQLANILKIEIPNAAEAGFSQVGKHAVDTAEYIQGIAAQLRGMFDVLSQPLDVEYKVLINGQDINIKKGDFERISAQTIAETYLSNLDRDAIVSAHSHMGADAGLNHLDLSNIIEDYYSGTAKIGATIGGEGIATWNLAGVKMEDAALAMEKIREHAEKFGDLPVKKINEIFKAINPEYTGVAKLWKPSEFANLAKYIYDIGEKSSTALTPLERFKNVLKNFVKGIDLSKYQNLLDDFKEENAGGLFNRIMKAEGVNIQVSDISKGSLDDVTKEIQKQKEQMLELRQSAQLTYNEIEKAAKEYYDSFNRASSDRTGADFFKKYFHVSELPNIDEMFYSIADGERDLTGVTRTLASYFGINPDDMPDVEFQRVGDSAQETGTKVKSLADSFKEYIATVRNAGDIEWNGDMETAYAQVLDNIKTDTFTTVEECISKFKELANISEVVKSAGADNSGGSGNGTGTGSGITEIDFTSLEGTIKSEIASLVTKLDSVLKVEVVKNDVTEIKAAIDGIKTSIDNIAASIDSYKNTNVDNQQQEQIDVIKNNLQQLHKFVNDFNNRKINGKYQFQEIGAHMSSDGAITAAYGENNQVPHLRLINAMLSNLSKSPLVDMHSHPLFTLADGNTATQSVFSNVGGDISAFKTSKALGYQMVAMITGNIFKSLDISKLTQDQMMKLEEALRKRESKYFAGKKNYDKDTDPIVRIDGVTKMRTGDTLDAERDITEIYEGFLYEAFKDIGYSKDRVNTELMRSYDLTDDAQLTQLATLLSQLSNASQNALAPVERLTNIISVLGGNVNTKEAKTIFESFSRGEKSALDVLNSFWDDQNFKVSTDAFNSLFTFDSANEMSVIESLLTQISAALDVIGSSVSSIDANTRKNTSEQLSSDINNLLDFRDVNDLGTDRVNRLLSSVESKFDSSNISEYKVNELYADAAAKTAQFKADLDYLSKLDLTKADTIDLNKAQSIFDNFILALRAVDDTIKQSKLYKDTYGKSVLNSKELDIGDYLTENFNTVFGGDKIKSLLAMLGRVKADWDSKVKPRNNQVDELFLDSSTMSNVLSGLQQVQDALNSNVTSISALQASVDNLAGIIKGFNVEGITQGMAETNKPDVTKTNKPANTTAVNNNIESYNKLIERIKDLIQLGNVAKNRDHFLLPKYDEHGKLYAGNGYSGNRQIVDNRASKSSIRQHLDEYALWKEKGRDNLAETSLQNLISCVATYKNLDEARDVFKKKELVIWQEVINRINAAEEAKRAYEKYNARNDVVFKDALRLGAPHVDSITFGDLSNFDKAIDTGSVEAVLDYLVKTFKFKIPEASDLASSEQISNPTQAAPDSEDNTDATTSDEINELDKLQQKLDDVRKAVDAKTVAFENEATVVDAVVDAEIAKLGKLEDKLTEVKSKIDSVGDAELPVETQTQQPESSNKRNPLIANAFKGMNIKEFLKRNVDKDAISQLEDEFYKLAQTYVDEDADAMDLQISNIADFIVQNSKTFRERKEENVYDEVFKALHVAYTEDDVKAMGPQLFERARSILGRKMQKASDKNKHFDRIDQLVDTLASNYPGLFDDPDGSESHYNKFDQLLNHVDAWKSEGTRKTRDVTLSQEDAQIIIDTIYGEMLYPMMKNIDEQRASANTRNEIGQVSLEGFSDVQEKPKTSSKKAVSEEVSQLEELRKKLIAVKTAVTEKTDAFNAEKDAVDSAVASEIAALSRLLEALQIVASQIDYVFSGLSYINSQDVQTPEDKTVWDEDGTQFDVNRQQHVGAQDDNVIADYALEGTLQTTNSILNEISGKINQEQDFSGLIGPLKNAVTELQNVANGIIQYQKAQKGDTASAMARIQDPKKRDYIIDIATNSVGNLSDEVQIKGLKALANGVVSVEGAFKNANDEWEGFTVKVNEANKAVDLAINLQSAFAKALNKAELAKKKAAEEKDNNRNLSSDETEKRALEHALEYAGKGQDATVQYKDSGRYTVALRETIGGLQKEVFQTFDDSLEDFTERTTVTMSTKAQATIKSMNDYISEHTNGFSDSKLLQEYQNEYKNLFDMTKNFSSKENLEQADINAWNQKISLVQTLGNKISGLIKQQEKLDGKTSIADSTKRLQEYQKNANAILKSLDFGLTTENKTDSQQQIVDIYDQIINKIDLLKQKHSSLTDEQAAEINELINLLEGAANAYTRIGTVAKSVETNKFITGNTNKISDKKLLGQYASEYETLMWLIEELESVDEVDQGFIDMLNQQSLAVQNLEAQIISLIQQQNRLDANRGLATTTKRLQTYQTDADKIFKGLDFGLNDKAKNADQVRIVDIYTKIIEKISELKKAHSNLTTSQIVEMNQLMATLQKEVDVYNNKVNAQKDAEQKKTAEQEAFKTSYDTQLDEFDKYQKEVQNASYVTDDLKSRISELETKLLSIDNVADLGKWQEEFKALSRDIELAKNSFNELSDAQIREARGSVNAALKDSRIGLNDSNLTTEQQAIIDAYRKAIQAINEYELNVEKSNKAEIAGVKEAISVLEEKVRLYKEHNDLSNVRSKNFGATVARRESVRYDRFNDLAMDERSGYSSSSEFMERFNKYKDAYDELIAKQKEFASLDSLTNAQVAEFDKLKDSCAELGKELDKLFRASEKMSKDAYHIEPLGKDFVDDDSGRKKALTDYVNQYHELSNSVITFNKNFTECTYTVKQADGTFLQMTAQIDAFGNKIIETAGSTKQATSTIGSFFDDLKAKGRSIVTYLISITGIEEIFQQIRQGFQYVLEIDTALTELKKVTNETNAEYDAFLQTMSKTASVVGSTVSELTTMAAEWARLGYSMEEAGRLAESTAILLNVSEFEDATTASEALISTMQAFSYTADESQRVVDILNEVGEFIAHR